MSHSDECEDRRSGVWQHVVSCRCDGEGAGSRGLHNTDVCLHDVTSQNTMILVLSVQVSLLPEDVHV
jgi:hypothetical protein